MKLSGRKAGNLTLFIDASSNEVVLKIQVDSQGRPLIAYHLYDARGRLVADSPEPREFPDGVQVRAEDDELLLDIPSDQQCHICYHLYSRQGQPLTVSDGMRTQVYPALRMDGRTMASGRSKDLV